MENKKKQKVEPLSNFQEPKTGRKDNYQYDEEIIQDERTFEITEAKINDDFCHYSYEIVTGVGLGDTHSVKGSGIIDDDMRTAFAKLNVHLAVIDDAFKNSSIEIKDIDKEHGHDLTGRYTVTGFKIKGAEENESIILMGNKYVTTAGGRMEVETPRIPLDSLSSYKWYNELKTAADDARLEVALYKEGKCTPIEIEEEEDDKAVQLTIMPGDDKDFDNAKVN